MAKYVPDISSRRWVIVSPNRINRHPDKKNKSEKRDCPFCEGNEKNTPQEVYRVGKGESNNRGWQVRVIPNKYPITDFHEVIVHSPQHDADIEDLPPEHIMLILQTYRQRYNFYKKNGQVMIFCNHGEHAGASQGHPHSQLVVLPNQINMDSLTLEPIANIVEETKFFTVYCPDFSQWPYEVWIASKTKGQVFGDVQDEQLADLAPLVQRLLKRLRKIYSETKFIKENFGYNFYIYQKENWFVRIIPRFVHRAGLELGTGLSVNIVDPVDARTALIDGDKRVHSVMEKLEKHIGK